MSLDRVIGTAGTSHPELPAAVRARSILLSTHQMLVEELPAPRPAAGSTPPGLSAAAVRYGFIEVDGVPYLVTLGQDDVRPGPLMAVATGLDDRLGDLHVLGDLGEWIHPSTDIRVADVLQDHLDCMVEPARDSMELLRLRVAPVRATGIWTRPPGAPAALAVDLERYETAEPDPWAAFAYEATRHLNEHHHDDLLRLARTSGATGCTAVSLTRLDPAGAILTAMSHDGLMDVVVPLDPPAATPGEASRRLTGTH